MPGGTTRVSDCPIKVAPMRLLAPAIQIRVSAASSGSLAKELLLAALGYGHHAPRRRFLTPGIPQQDKWDDEPRFGFQDDAFHSNLGIRHGFDVARECLGLLSGIDVTQQFTPIRAKFHAADVRRMLFQMLSGRIDLPLAEL